MMALNLGNEIESQSDTYHKRILPMKIKMKADVGCVTVSASILATLALFSHV
jgi:hypothetical protein